MFSQVSQCASSTRMSGRTCACSPLVYTRHMKSLTTTVTPMEPRRVLILARLSRTTDESTSIERQIILGHKTAEERWPNIAKENRLEFTEIVSGAADLEDRPALTEIMNMWGPGDVVVFWKLDRIARSIRNFMDIVEAGTRVGVTFVSATERDFDFTTPTGKMVAQLFAILAEWERSMIAARSKESHAHLKSVGRWPGGRIPYGLAAVKNPNGDGKIAIRDLDARTIIRELAERITEGEGMQKIADDLNKRGIPSPRMATATIKKDKGTVKITPWSRPSICHVMRNETHLGYRLDKGKPVRGDDGMPIVEWEPIFSQAEWDAVQAVMDGKSFRQPSAAKHWLIGSLKCAECGNNLAQNVNKGVRAFRCIESRDTVPASCGVRIPQDRLTEWLTEEVPELFGNVAQMERVWYPGDTIGEELDQVIRAIQNLRNDRDAGLYDGEDDERDYTGRMKNLTMRRTHLRSLPRKAAGWHTAPRETTFGQEWETADEGGRAKLLQAANLAAYVRPAKGVKNLPADKQCYIAARDGHEPSLMDWLTAALD